MKTAVFYKMFGGKQDIYTTFTADTIDEIISKAEVYYYHGGLIGRFYLDIEGQTYQINNIN